MNKIGKTIADLRKANNMTQSEVADILGVSYQAVSKWERDESLPDITLLPQIADLYHISIDQLLRGGFEMKEEEIQKAKEIVEEITIEPDPKESNEKDNPVDLGETIQAYVNQEIDEAFSGAFENLLPLMKPKKIRHVLKNKKVKLGAFSKKAYEFMDANTMEQMIDEMDELDEKSFDQLTALLPMCNSRTKDKVVQLICESELDNYDLTEILPFFNKTQINMLLEHYLENVEREDALDQLEEFLPFLNHEGKDKIVEYILDGDLDDIDLENLMPFLNADHKNRLVDEIIMQENAWEQLEDILPFLNSVQKKKLLSQTYEQMNLSELSNFAPFMDKEDMTQLINRYIEDERDDDISDFYPFLSHDAKKALIKYYIDHKKSDELMELASYIH